MEIGYFLYFTKSGPLADSIYITWELIKKVNFQVLPLTFWTEPLGMGPSFPVFYSSSQDFDAC